MRAKAITVVDQAGTRVAICSFFRVRYVIMRVQSGHWLDYDPVALVVLVLGIGAVALLALSI
jgi:hypothetical protein